VLPAALLLAGSTALTSGFARQGYFITPIFHPNVAKNGEICVNTLKKDWKSDCKLSHILMVVRCLLIEPNPGMPCKCWCNGWCNGSLLLFLPLSLPPCTSSRILKCWCALPLALFVWRRAVRVHALVDPFRLFYPCIPSILKPHS